MSLPLPGWCRVAVAAALAAGCRGPSGDYPLPPEGTRSQIRLGQVGEWYRLHLAKCGRPPADPAAFEEFVRRLPDETRGVAAADVSACLVSPRDHAPLVVLCGPDAPAGRTEAVVAHERVGVGGRKFAAFSTGRAELLTAEQSRRLAP